MLTRLFVFCCLVLAGFFSFTLNAADKSIGKLFVKAVDANVDGQQFANPELANTVKDIKARRGKFIVVDDESQADFLMIVLDRKTELRSQLGTPQNYRLVSATLSVKDGSSWKPACKLVNDGFKGGASWGNAAVDIVKKAENCANQNRVK